MPKSTKFILLLASLLTDTTPAFAEVSSRNSADIGFTSNANLTTNNEQSDFYYKISTNNRLSRSLQTLSFRLSYTDYFEQHANDYLALTLQNQWGDLKSTLFTAALVGQHFPNGSAGTTEAAFNSFGINFNAARAWREGKIDGDAGVGYRMRYYPSFDGRNDHNGYGFGSATYEFSRKITFLGYAEGGATWSTLPDYSRIYAEVTGTAELLLSDRWVLTNDITIGRSYFLSRSVTTQTRVFNKGRTGTSSSTSNERYTNVTLSTEAMRSQTEDFKWGAGASYSSQGSLSGFQDYSVLTAEAKLILMF